MAAIRVQTATNDALDKVFVRGICGCDGVNKVTVAQNRGAVGDFTHFVDIVADKDHACALRGTLAHEVKELLDTCAGQKRGWLIEDKNARAIGVVLTGLSQILISADDCKQGLLYGGQGAHRQSRVKGEAEFGKDLRRSVVGHGPVQGPVVGCRKTAQKKVLRHAERRDQAEMLMHESQAHVANIGP